MSTRGFVCVDERKCVMYIEHDQGITKVLQFFHELPTKKHIRVNSRFRERIYQIRQKLMVDYRQQVIKQVKSHLGHVDLLILSIETKFDDFYDSSMDEQFDIIFHIDHSEQSMVDKAIDKFNVIQEAALVIQRGCHNWIWSPKRKDTGLPGIRPTLDSKTLGLLGKNEKRARPDQ